MKDILIKQIASVFEISGTQLSKEALRLIVLDLQKYDEIEIVNALQKCRHEVTGRLSLAHIIQRIPKKQNDRPSADEAFAMLPFSENQSVVWTQEMAEAFSIVHELYYNDQVGCRMAFRESYNRLCLESETSNRPVVWEISLGMYKPGRESVLKEAIDKGRITEKQAIRIFPELANKNRSQERLFGGTAQSQDRQMRTLPEHIGDDKPCAEEDISVYIQNLKKSMDVNF